MALIMWFKIPKVEIENNLEFRIFWIILGIFAINSTRAFRTRPFRRTRTQTEVRNSDSDLRNRDFPKDDCSGKGLKIWLENLRNFLLTLQVHFNLVVYTSRFKWKCK
jgi:hypothetical protein